MTHLVKQHGAAGRLTRHLDMRFGSVKLASTPFVLIAPRIRSVLFGDALVLRLLLRGLLSAYPLWTRGSNTSKLLSDVPDEPDGLALPRKRCLRKRTTMREQ